LAGWTIDSDIQTSPCVRVAGAPEPELSAKLDRKARDYHRRSTPDSGGGAPPPDRVDRATLERLRSLGYLSVSQRKTAPVDFAKLPDPKDKIEIC